MEVTRESNQGLDQGKANQYAFSGGMTGAFPKMRVAQLLEEMPWLQQDGSLQELSGLWIWMAMEEFGIGIGIGNLLYLVSRVRVQNRNRKHYTWWAGSEYKIGIGIEESWAIWKEDDMEKLKISALFEWRVGRGWWYLYLGWGYLFITHCTEEQRDPWPEVFAYRRSTRERKPVTAAPAYSIGLTS